MRARSRATWASTSPAIRRSYRRTCRAPAGSRSRTIFTMSRPRTAPSIAIFARGIPMERLLGRTAGHQFDATKFTWIGSITDEPSVCAFWHQSAISTWEDMKTKAYKLGGSGILTDLDIYSNVLHNMFHLKSRLISGFPGGSDVVLSMQRREVDGRCGWSWSSLYGLDRHMLDQKLAHDSGATGNGENPRAARRAADPRPDRRSEGEGRAAADLLAPDDGASVCGAAQV